MTPRLPNGCDAEWIKQPARQDRLLDWLESHPLERQCLFNAKTGRHLNKTTCANMAAKAIFTQDGNPANRAAVKEDPEPFGGAILTLIRLQWQPKYQKVNKAVGRDAARTPYTDLDPNSNAKKVVGQSFAGIQTEKETETFNIIVERQMIKFPQWARLHDFWRLLPEFNQFADEQEKSRNSPSRNSGRKRRNTCDVEEEGSDDSDESHQTRKFALQPQTRVRIGPPGRGAKRIKRSTALPQSIKVEAEAAKDEKVVINIEDNEPEGSCVSTGTSNTAALTRDQQFKKEMAELRLRTQEQEFKAKEQELKALLMQKKHEALMAFLQSSEN